MHLRNLCCTLLFCLTCLSLSPCSRADEFAGGWVGHLIWEAPIPHGSGLNTQEGDSWSAGASHSQGGASAWATFTRETDHTEHSIVAIIFHYEVEFEWTTPDMQPTMLSVMITNVATASCGYGTNFFDAVGLESTGAQASESTPTVEAQTYKPDGGPPPTKIQVYNIGQGTTLLVDARCQEALAEQGSFGSTHRYVVDVHGKRDNS